MDDFLNQQYPAGLLSTLGINPEDLRRQQQRAGLLSAGLQLLAGSGYSPVRQTTGQLVGQAGMAGLQGMQQAGQSAVERAIQGLQVSDIARKSQEASALRSAMQQPTMQAQIQQLQQLGRYDLIKNLAESQQALRRVGLATPTAGTEELPSPFAPYLAAQSPNVRELAQTYDRGFKSGRIDEDTADRRLADLARMEESFVGRVEAATDRRIAREEARSDRQIAREQAQKPTEGEKKTATLAGRLEQSLTDLQAIEQEKPGALKPEVAPSLLQSGMLSYIPGAEMIAGKISSADRLRAEAAQLDALDAALTLGTGAAYTREQLRGYAKAYFPQIGDTPAVIEEKNRRFANIVRLARSQAGSAYVPPAQGVTPNLSGVRGKYNLEGK
jgi:hypothetical protein